MTDKQQQAIVAAKGGKNISLVGNAGTGKTTTIKNIITDNSVVVAPSAVAAQNVGGSTVHSMFSLSHGLQTDKDLNRITPDMKQLFNIDSPIDRIVFDEAYTLPVNLIDDVDHKLKKIRGNDLPFGGIPVIMSGDPLQGCPFYSPQETRIIRRKYDSYFIFDSNVWKQNTPEVIVLDKIYRNTNTDQQDLLNAIRVKSEGWIEAVHSINDIATIGEYDPDADLHICTYKKDAYNMNMRYYNKISNKEFVYSAIIDGSFNKSELPADKELHLKVGSRVIFTVNNYDIGYLNGTRGVVKYLDNQTIIVQKDDGVEVVVEQNEWKNERLKVFGGQLTKIKAGTMKQYPLRLGYSSTISSCQGLTLDKACIDFGSDAFGDGFVYTGLSRLRDLTNLTLVRGLRHADVKVNDKALKFVNKYK